MSRRNASTAKRPANGRNRHLATSGGGRNGRAIPDEGDGAIHGG